MGSDAVLSHLAGEARTRSRRPQKRLQLSKAGVLPCLLQGQSEHHMVPFHFLGIDKMVINLGTDGGTTILQAPLLEMAW